MAQKKRGAGRAAGGGKDSVLSLEQLSRFANIMGASMETSILVEDATEPLMSLVGAEGLLIALTDETDRFLRPAADTNWGHKLAPKPIPINAVASLGTEAVAFDSGAALPETLADHLGGIEEPLLLMPLWAHGRVRGVMAMRRRGEPFATSSVKLLTAAGRQFAMAVENSRLLSELQVSYRDLMDTQEELIRAERLAAMAQLAATMAHEIRNPLATIFSAISQIRKHSRSDGVSATLLDIAEEEAARMNTMVGGLLDFARPRKPSFEARRPLEIVKEVARVAADAEGAPEGIRIAVDPSSDDPVASIDPELLQRALNRLMDNAVKAIEGEGEVTLRVRRGDGREAAAIIEIEDNGCGIPRELLSRVLEPFYSTRPSGIGLGLPTARRVAEDHGGTLEISSEAGRGTTVRLLLGAKARSRAGAEKTE